MFLKSKKTTSSQEKTWGDFYRAFEDRFRGSFDTITTRLKNRYSSLLAPEAKGKKALDLGCGRGEMSYMLASLGYETTGVDQMTQMLPDSYKNTHLLHFVEADLLSFLLKQKSKSYDLICLLHVIEHCPKEYVYQTIKEIYRLLLPNGRLLIELPSHFSLWASQRQFYLDPTHLFPVHPDYLSFMLEFIGFKNIEPLCFDPVEDPQKANLEGLFEKKEINEAFKKLSDWLYGPMDYGFLASRDGVK